MKQPTHEEYGEPVGSPLFDGMSPTSPTGANVPSIAGVMSVGGSVLPSTSSRTSLAEAKAI